MTLKTPAEQAVTDLAARFSTDLPWVETVTYNGEPIPAIVGEFREEEVDGARVEVVDIEVQASDVTTPAYRDTVVIDSTTWRVKAFTGGGGITWQVRLTANERPLWR